MDKKGSGFDGCCAPERVCFCRHFSSARSAHPPEGSNLDDDIDNQMKPEEKQAVDAIRETTGIGVTSAQAVIAVTGTDMSRFPTDAHISSWADLCPGDNESAKKRRSGKTRKGSHLLRPALIVCVHSAARVKNSYFRAQFQRISARRGSKRAYVAAAHSMLTAIYHMLKDGVAFQDLGTDYYNQFNKERKSSPHKVLFHSKI